MRFSEDIPTMTRGRERGREGRGREGGREGGEREGGREGGKGEGGGRGKVIRYILFAQQ